MKWAAQLSVIMLAGPRDHSEITKQVRWSHAKRRRNPQDDDQRRDVITTLDETNVGCADFRAFGELVLGEPSLLPKAAHDRTKLFCLRQAIFSMRHPCILTIASLYCRLTMVK